MQTQEFQSSSYARNSLDKSISGSRSAEVCSCRRVELTSEKVVQNGLRLIRLRFGLHRSELPLLRPSNLKDYLLSLLAGAGKTCLTGPVRRFPRQLTGWDPEGFPIYRRLSRAHRWELAHSCASLARSLPDNCIACTPSSYEGWLHRATSSPSPSSPDYLAFVRKVVKREFRFGWDSHRYPLSAQTFAPKNSSRSEKMPCGLPWKGSEWWSSKSSKREFLLATLRGRLPRALDKERACSCRRCSRDISRGFHLRYKEVATPGKLRPLGIPSVKYDLLGPLHKAIYGHLTSRRWLVHGDVRRHHIRGACVGTTQTSVDLVNATDGLRLDVTEAILSSILSKTSAVPGLVKEWAHESLSAGILASGEMTGEVSHGQMMGTYLSFPLLCLHSYCAAKWAARKSQLRGILVNGDDTAISHDLPLGQYPDGYEINMKKTMVANNCVELNSTVFLRSGGGWKQVRNLRRGGGVSDFAGLYHMAQACVKAGPSWVSAFVRSKMGKRWNLSARDLGLPMNHLLVYHYDRRQRGGGSRVNRPEPVVTDRYRIVSSEPGFAAKVAFSYDLFDNGRESPVVKEFNPPRSHVLKTCLSARPLRFTASGRRFGDWISFNPKETRRNSPRVWMKLSEWGDDEERVEPWSVETPLDTLRSRAGNADWSAGPLLRTSLFSELGRARAWRNDACVFERPSYGGWFRD